MCVRVCMYVCELMKENLMLLSVLVILRHLRGDQQTSIPAVQGCGTCPISILTKDDPKLLINQEGDYKALTEMF